MDTLIAANQTWALWTVLLAAAALGLWAERTRWGARFSGAIVTLLAGFALSNLKVIPVSASVYETVWQFLVPLAIPLLLLHADFKRVVRESGPTVAAFGIGAVGTVVGTLVAFYFVPMGEHAWQVAAVFSATYVGGAANTALTADAVGLVPGTLRSAIGAADQLMVAAYLLVLFTLPTLRHLRRQYREHTPQRWGTTTVIVGAESRSGARINLPGVATALSLAAGICALGYFAQARLHWQGTAVVVIALVSLLVAGVFARRLQPVDGPAELGTLLMQLLFATIGAGAHVGTVLVLGPLLFIYAAVVLAVHLAVILVVGRFARLSLPEILIGSSADMGGVPVAAAVAAARRWDALVVPAVICGALGYAIGPHLGALLGHWLH
ncbi:MAG: DUF819 family protein [Gammaproteobacteria bacterium]